MADEKITAGVLPKKGRRGHGTVESNKRLRKTVDKWLEESPRPTLDQMVARLDETTFNVSRSALHRYMVKFDTSRERVRDLQEMAAAFSEDGGDVLQLEKASAQLALAKLFEALMSEDGVTDQTLEKVYAIAKLQSSGASRERARLVVSRGIERALTTVRRELETLLSDDPKLLRKVVEKLEEVRERQTGGNA